MATAGPRYPGTVATEIGPSGDNDWLTASSIGADDGSEAQITAATYDATDHSYRLKATNFGFSADIPAGSTINGITVEIDRRCFAGAAQDQEVRLYDSTGTLVGSDKQTATAWPATLAVATYGSSSDTWASGLDADDIRSAGFGVALIVLADGANTDIGVDFIRVTVDYTPPAPSGTGAISVPAATVAGTGTLVLTGTGAISVPAPTVAGTGAEVFTATGAVSVPAATVDGSGAEVFTATGAVSVPAAPVAGSGDHTEGGPAPVTGTGAISVPAATVAGSGTLILTGTGAIAVPAATVDGSGSSTLVITGTGSITTPAATVSGEGYGSSGTPPDPTIIAAVPDPTIIAAATDATIASAIPSQRVIHARPELH
jgi:hypothetical protein